MGGVVGESNKTVSMMWTTPLLVITSVAITFAWLSDDTILTPFELITVMDSGPAVFTVVLPAGISPALMTVGSTCLKSTAFSCSIFSGFKRLANASAGILAKASLVGAKTVNGPFPLNTSTNPAACTAVTRVDNAGVATAASTIVGNGVAVVVGRR